MLGLDLLVRALGVNIANGVLYLAALDEVTPSTEAHGAPAGPPRRVQPNMGLSDAFRVSDLHDRFAQDLRSIDPDVVGVVGTRQFNGLTNKIAVKRVSALAAVQIACVKSDKPCREVKTEEIAAKVKAPAKNLQEADPAQFGLDGAVRYWTSGLAEAFGAAAVLLPATEPVNASE